MPGKRIRQELVGELQQLVAANQDRTQNPACMSHPPILRPDVHGSSVE